MMMTESQTKMRNENFKSVLLSPRVHQDEEEEGDEGTY
jgi:hypothetical protein